MATTLTKILVHFIFSTKNRTPIITPSLEPHLYAYMRGIAENHKSPILSINGTEDHVHLLVSLAKTITLADLMEEIKKSSSTWIKDQSPEFANFHWQDGYAAFSLGESALPTVRRYIDNQKSHHHKLTFKEELLMFLNKYRIDYNEQYLWN